MFIYPIQEKLERSDDIEYLFEATFSDHRSSLITRSGIWEVNLE